ncbi:MAG: phosphate/phosphite/phosphonate ABC transporter substrate-binding protein [Sporomusaceae bacterium]|nr:phosphate/phosphite/phosphonate ABC transporter substrate-binding protein [Sporomusaceae bacterium]
MRKKQWRLAGLLGCMGVLLGVIFAAWPHYAAQQQVDILFHQRLDVPTVSAKTPNAQALRVAVSSVLSPKQTIGYYRAIADYLGEALGRPVILIQRQNYGEIGMLLLNGGADIAFFSGGEYAAYSNFTDIELLVSQVRQGAPYYEGYLLVPKDSTSQSLADLRGKSVAFTDPLSYSGYSFIAYQLRQNGETPERFFSHYLYTYSHDKSLRAVASKVVDAAPVTSLAYNKAKLTAPDLAAAVRIIAVSPPAGIGPVVAGKTLTVEEREKLRSLFLTMHTEPRLAAALQGLLIDRFIMPQPELYIINRKMMGSNQER